ncbi:MAG: hypothetical protein U9O94_07505 [Nanoarchaeota archaeon]|nr:hypothetical protein [Nanoarchaeota archaeon]
MAKEKTSRGTKVKKKKWTSVLAPKSFGNDIIGEVYAYDPKSLIGRVVTVNLMGLTGDMKKQNTNLKFNISHSEGPNVITALTGYYIVSASIRRLVRRGKKRLDFSFICKTSDNKRVRIKPLMIPRSGTKSSTSRDLRKATIDYVTNYISKLTFENAIRNLMAHKIQRAIRDELKKVYPIKISEITALYIEEGKKTFGQKEELKLREVTEEEAPKEENKKAEEESPKESEEGKEEKAEAPKEEKKEEKAEEEKPKAVEEKKEEYKEKKSEAPKKEEPPKKEE